MYKVQPGDSDREWRPSGDPISAQQLATTLPGQLAQGGVETLPLDKDPASLASAGANQPLPRRPPSL